MDFLEVPKIFLNGQKVLCVDEEIYHEETDRQIFTLKSGFYYEDIFFTDAFDSALELLEAHPEISIIILDLRIPKNSQSYYDYNPENPQEEWGKKLINEIEKRYYGQRTINIIVISGYTVYSYSNSSQKSSVLAFQEKPINYRLLNKNLESILTKDLVVSIDYSDLNSEVSEFVRERTKKIKERIARIENDIIVIGKYLIEVKEKLEPVGQYLKWLEIEFRWSDRQARRYVSVAKKFGDWVDRLSTLDIERTAYWLLAEEKTPPEAVEEILTIAETTKETVTSSLVREIREKYSKNESGKARKSEKIQASPESSRDRVKDSVKEVANKKNKKIDKAITSDPSKTKLEILEVKYKIAKNSYWRLGEHHKLFCGQPIEPQFLELLPRKISLTINLPPNNDCSLIPTIKSKSSFTFYSKYNDIELNTVLESVKPIILGSTESQEVIVFCYSFDPQLLELADELACYCYVAEPDLHKCEQILGVWRERSSVSRLKI